MAGPGPCFGGTGSTEESGVLSKTMHSIICRGSLFTDELWTLKTCQASLAFAYLWAPRMALGGEEPLEEGMATHIRILAWRILWTEKPGGLQSIGSQRVEQDSAQHSTALFTSTMWSSVFIEFPQTAPRCSSLHVFAHVFPATCHVFL